jgi:hypothetical protein
VPAGKRKRNNKIEIIGEKKLFFMVFSVPAIL